MQRQRDKQAADKPTPLAGASQDGLLTQGVAGISFVLSAALIASPLMVLNLRQRPYFQEG